MNRTINLVLGWSVCLSGLPATMAFAEAVASSPAAPGPATVAVLSADLPGHDADFCDLLGDCLRRRGFRVSLLSAAEVCDTNVLARESFFLYVIPQCQAYPAAGMEALTSYVRQGGHVLFLGGPLLDDPVWQRNGTWFNRRDLAAALRNVRPRHFPFGAMAQDAGSWRRACSDPHSPGTWTVVAEGPQGESCFKFWTKNYAGWDGYLSPSTPGLFSTGDGVFTFQAKGSEGTPQMAVEIQEMDGSRWIAVAELGTNWRRITLTLADFKYWQDSPTGNRRGRGGDHLVPEKARRVNFQLAHSHTVAVPPGEHSFWVAGIGTCANPVGDVQQTTPGSLSLETVFPRYKVFPVDTRVKVRRAANATWLGDHDWPSISKPICAVPRTMGRGFQRGQRWRYCPLLCASDDEGHDRGSPAWLLLDRHGTSAGSVLACLGANDIRLLATAPLLDALGDIAERIQQGLFLDEAGTEHFAYWPGERIRLGATLENVADVARTVSVTLAVRDERDNERFTATRSLQLLPRARTSWQQEIDLGDKKPAVYTVEAKVRYHDTVVDILQHQFSVLGTGSVAGDQYITVRGSNFYWNGRPWYPVGVNYWPLYVSGMDHRDYQAGWIRREYYEPELVEEDLVRMEGLGINLVSIQAHDPRYYRNLLDFVRRCGRHGIHVNLYCGLASPLGFREQALRRFIGTARLAENPTIMAYDTTWEPGNYVFRGDRRSNWDAQWRAWIIEQYESVENAQKDWEFTGPRDTQGRLACPPDRQFREDGPWRRMVAAYRRFMDDVTSRRWNQAYRKIREIDPRHLVSFRQGNTLPHDFVFTGTAKHVDFMCPEGYSIPASRDGYDAAGFITRYVHFTTGGKPVVWSEFGQSVWGAATMAPSPSRITAVAEYHELFYRMVLESGANGTIPWWWPGGYRVGEQSDYGIVNRDGTFRPAAKLIARYGPQLKAARDWPAPTVWYEMDRDAHAGGYWQVCFHEGMDAYRQAAKTHQNLGIRTAGTGTTSANTPWLAVGNTRCTGKNPPKFLNAEFNWLQIRDADGSWVEARDGSRITVSRDKAIVARIGVGNTQEATWLAPNEGTVQDGDVVLMTTAASELTGRWPLPETTGYLHDADFGTIALAPRIDRLTRVELRMSVAGRTGFGEKRTFALVPDGS